MTRRQWFLSAAVTTLPVRAQVPQAGSMLVATPASHDSDLARSVILIVHSGTNGVTGLMLNRPTDAAVSTLFPNLKRDPDLVYRGGPIEQNVQALVRPPAKPLEADIVANNVFLVSKVRSIEALVSSGTPASEFRVFAGYTGWTAGQLRNELLAGLWRVRPAQAGVVFDSDPKSLWTRLTSGR